MKKILFGTSAMLAAAFASAGGASAAGLSLGVSGGYTFGAGFTSADLGISGVSDAKGYLIADGNLAFEGKGTLDNGLTFGGVMKTDVENSFEVDESYGYVSGSFGRLVIGHDDGAHDWAVVAPPCVGFSCAADGTGMLFDRASGVFGVNNISWGFDGADTGDAMKVSYFTPSFWGLSAGASWVPDSTDSGTNPADWVVSSQNEAFEVGAKYSTKAGALSTDVGVGYTNYGGDNDTWAMGVVLGYNGFKIGGNMESIINGDTGFGVAASYGTGPWAFGVSYAQGNSVADAAADGRGASVGVSYELGKGVTLNGGLEWADVNNTSAFGGGVSTSLSF